MAKTIHETIAELRTAFIEYINAAYHIGNPQLVEQRNELLKKIGVVHQTPYLESTPRYQSGCMFNQIASLPPAALELFEILSTNSTTQKPLLYNPPYKHQSDALIGSLIKEKNLVIMTGTGSGKTESFLLPILGKLAKEANEHPQTFQSQDAVRALVLYPMNALVNDQLGRLRAFFGNPQLQTLFQKWCGRTTTFARYTSRTPYAGVRSKNKDQIKLKSFNDFYVNILQKSQSAFQPERDNARNLLDQLVQRGKWPAKHDIEAWFGEEGSHWQDKSGKFLRAVSLPDDAELITRHEVQECVPDLLVTNYSMLEYMLMRPIERRIFDQTKAWLENNPNEKFLVVLDEAHLYRGAAGAEVGLLLRRLRERLGIDENRFQVICATASFSKAEYSLEFASGLAGVPLDTFEPAIQGSFAYKDGASVGSYNDATLLANLNLESFYNENPQERLKSIEPLLSYFGVQNSGEVERDLYKALLNFKPLELLVNWTMPEARAISSIGNKLFPDVKVDLADAAVTNLLIIASTARASAHESSLLPCRIHNFFRGLPGLWICMDPECNQLDPTHKSTLCGKMYSQPRETCDCGSRVLEFFTCRYCGSAYARAYCVNVEDPRSLWSDPGKRLYDGAHEISSLSALDLLLEKPRQIELAEIADYDLETGQINPEITGNRMRSVYIRANRTSDHRIEDDEDEETVMSSGLGRGDFQPCPVCSQSGRMGRSSIQDHETKGDQPFQALLAKQLQIQPPSPMAATKFAPLRGRKVLAFSDSRQVAARLAPNLQMYSARDSLRPLIVRGYKKLLSATILKNRLSLEDLYFSVLLSACELQVRLRPELSYGETFNAYTVVSKALQNDPLISDQTLFDLCTEVRDGDNPPAALLGDLIKTLQDRSLGLEALAIASIAERADKTQLILKLPNITGVAETEESKLALARAWLRCWHRAGFWLKSMPNTWYLNHSENGVKIQGNKGIFANQMKRILQTPSAKKAFKEQWLPELKSIFTEDAGSGDKRRLIGRHLTLKFDGSWVRCSDCKSVHRPIPGTNTCIDCGQNAVAPLDAMNDLVFNARKGYYRRSILAALETPPVAPMALIAAEHTAQLNSPQSEDAFSKAEENELLFQDVDISILSKNFSSSAVDVLSSTTTMEVGIDIGALSGVALRNMPPGRANYQQRAGRAGRRGNTVATVVAYGGMDTHDEHYFSHPDAMIRGPVIDPSLTLNNVDIVKRHIRAFLLQSYHQVRLPLFDASQTLGDLFSVLGKVSDFCAPTSLLNRDDFVTWLTENETELKKRVATWIPKELSIENQHTLINSMLPDCIQAINKALAEAMSVTHIKNKEDSIEEKLEESQPELGEERPRNNYIGDRNLLDWLLYKGVLPRYAFPTDVATFHIFDNGQSTSYRPVMRFAPTQGLPVALSQYAPGKQVWVSGKCYTSGAIYSPITEERNTSWKSRRLYLECVKCGYAKTMLVNQGVNVKDVLNCEACQGINTVGPVRYWMRPPGFAHPIDVPVVTSPDEIPETSYATRAKLTMLSPAEDDRWSLIKPQIKVIKDRTHLLVTNSGPGREGYAYCTSCGRIESASDQTMLLHAPHSKPFIDEKQQECAGGYLSPNIVLGTDFITDIALFSIHLKSPFRLPPGSFYTNIALRTVSEALARAASNLLEIEPGEIMAEYRPALTNEGVKGIDAEIFLYDTLPGGAGFAHAIAKRGIEVFNEALKLLKECKEQCDASCYRCLRTFRNKTEHGSLDRHTGILLIEHLLSGTTPSFDFKRMNISMNILCSDLRRQETDIKTIEVAKLINTSNSGELEVPVLVTLNNGKQAVVGLSPPLADEVPESINLLNLQKSGEIPVVTVNELLVRGNLPAATTIILNKLNALS